MRKIFWMMALILCGVAISCDDDYNPSQSLNTAFHAQYPDARDVEWERKGKHVVAEFKLPSVSNDCDAWYLRKTGEWVLTDFEISFSALPEAVQTAFHGEYGELAPVDSVNHIDRNGKSDVFVIETEAVVNGFLADICVEYSEDGTKIRTNVDYEFFDYIDYYLD